jgi:hypothetical protein
MKNVHCKYYYNNTRALRDDATLQAVQAVPFQKAMQAVDCVSRAYGIEAGLAAFHPLSYGLLQSRDFSNALLTLRLSIYLPGDLFFVGFRDW